MKQIRSKLKFRVKGLFQITNFWLKTIIGEVLGKIIGET
jgi:hypothetical protein